MQQAAHTRPQIYPFHYSFGFRAFAFNYSEFTVAHSSIHHNNNAAAAGAALVAMGRDGGACSPLSLQYHFCVFAAAVAAAVQLEARANNGTGLTATTATYRFIIHYCGGNDVGNCLNY